MLLQEASHTRPFVWIGAKGVSQRELAKRLEVSRWTIQQVDG